jgi:hypothetical protein
MRRTHQDRYEPTLAYMLAEQARSGGVDLDATPGPWRASLLRHEFELLPVVTNDRTEIVVGDIERAVDVAGLLNWCGVDDLRPVPDLTPPIDSELVEDEVFTGAR